MNEEIETIKAAHIDTINIIEGLNKEQEAFTTQIEEKKQEIDNINAIQQRFADDLAAKTKEHDALQEKYESGELDRDNLEMEVQNHLNNIKEKESALEDAHGKIMTMKNAGTQDKEADETIHAEKDTVIEAQKGELEEIRKSIDAIPDLEKQCESLATEIEDLNK